MGSPLWQRGYGTPQPAHADTNTNLAHALAQTLAQTLAHALANALAHAPTVQTHPLKRPLDTPKQRQTPEAGPRGSSKIATQSDRVICQNDLHHSFALCLFTSQLAGTPNRFGFFAGLLDRRLFEMLTQLHLPEHTFALKLFLQCTERLVDVIIANRNLHVVVTTFLSLSCMKLQEVAL